MNLNEDLPENQISLISENLVYSEEANPWVTLYFDVVRFPDGRIGNYNRVVEGQGYPGVAILFMAQRRICLVKQYRYPIQKSLWEIPRGFGESEDSVLDAIRELCEETGVDAKLLMHSDVKFLDLGEVHPNSGLLASKVRLFGVVSDVSIPTNSQASREVANVGWFPVEWVFSKIAQSEITDSFTMAAILKMNLLKLL